MNRPASPQKFPVSEGLFGKIVLLSALLLSVPTFAHAQQTPQFTTGNLVVAVEGCGVNAGTCTNVPNGTGPSGGYGDNQAAPFTLFQFAPSGTAAATFVNSLVLPQNPLRRKLSCHG